MKIEIQFTLVYNENLLLANLYALTSINKGLKTKSVDLGKQTSSNGDSRTTPVTKTVLEQNTKIFYKYWEDQNMDWDMFPSKFPSVHI